MERITLSDSMESAIIKMVEGNIGAMNVCMLLIKEGANVITANRPISDLLNAFKQ